MRVQMVTLMAGPDGVIEPGRVVDVPPALAQLLVAGGYATHIPTPTPAPRLVEGEMAAVEPAGEKAVQPRPKRKKAG